MGNKDAIYKHLRDNPLNVVYGLEGCGKSRDVLKTILETDLIDFSTEIVIYATNSYKLLLEKQRDLMQYHGLSKDECPICTLTEFENLNIKLIVPFEENNYTEDSWLNDAMKQYSSKAKIVFLTLSAVQKCHHLKITCSDGIDKSIKRVIIDEFEFTSCIIPKLSALTYSMMERTVNFNALNHIKSSFTHNDFLNYKKNLDGYHIADYVSKAIYNREYDFTFITSEILPCEIISNFGNFNRHFEFINLDESDESEKAEKAEKDLSKYIVYYKKDHINSYVFDELNKQNAWGLFGFKKIISDKCTATDHEIDVISHIGCRGSNSFNGDETLLTIISHIPKRGIINIQEALNYLTGTGCINIPEEGYSFRDVECKFYRDRLMQAVGRVIGHRNKSNNVYVLIDNAIMDNILEHLGHLGDLGDKDNLKIPYTLKKSDLKIEENDEWQNIKYTSENKRLNHQNKVKNHKKTYKKNKYHDKKRKMDTMSRYFLVSYFEIGEKKTSVITNAELKEIFKSRGLTKPSTKVIINQFKGYVKEGIKWIDGKQCRAIRGLKYKGDKGEVK